MPTIYYHAEFPKIEAYNIIIMCMSIFSKEDDVHVHLHPKYQSYAVYMCKQCQGHGLYTIIKDSWIRVKARQESAGGLKVRALAQTARVQVQVLPSGQSFLA